MIEVRVGSIDRHPVTGAPLVSLEPRQPLNRTRLVLPLSAAAACSLSHELEGQTTLRGTVYTLLGQVADILGGQIAAVEIVPAPNGMAAGHLRICSPDNAMLMPVEIALGIGLAVVLGVPLCVDDRLVHEAPRLDQPAEDEATPEKPATAQPAAALEVPDAFRRAFY
jgi:bifunctional DNase/RNase